MGFPIEHSAVPFDDRITNGETQTAPERLGGEIRIENLAGDLFRNSSTPVRHCHLDITPSRKTSAAAIFEREISRGNFDCATVKHGFARIDHQSVDDLFDLRRIDLGLPEIRR